MSNQELRAQAQTSAPQIKIAAGLWVMGLMIIMVTTIAWLVISVAWTNDYFAFSKGVHDAAEGRLLSTGLPDRNPNHHSLDAASGGPGVINIAAGVRLRFRQHSAERPAPRQHHGRGPTRTQGSQIFSFITNRNKPQTITVSQRRKHGNYNPRFFSRHSV